MKFSLITVAAIAGFAAASPIADALVARQSQDLTNQILQNITTTRSDLKKLNDSINASNDPNHQYSFFELIAIQSASNQVQSDLNSTAGTANRSTVASSANSARVYDAVQNGLRPDTLSVLGNLDYHYPGLKAGGQAGTVADSLSQQREISRQLGNALTAKASSDYKQRASDTTTQILSRLDQSISKFRS